jgi:hypothetical protein
VESKLPTKSKWNEFVLKFKLKDDQLIAALGKEIEAHEKTKKDDFDKRIANLVSIRSRAVAGERTQQNAKVAEFLASIAREADSERGNTSKAKKAAKDRSDETVSLPEAEARIKKIKLSGLLLNRNLVEVNDQEILNQLKRYGWREGTGTHFTKRLKERGPKCHVTTGADLNRAIQAGHSEADEDGKWIHRSGSAIIVYNPVDYYLISFGFP